MFELIFVSVFGVFLGIVFGVLFGRLAIHWGIFFLIVGIGPLFCSGVYEIFFNKTTEPSLAGMAAIVMLIDVVPFSLTLILVGWFRRCGNLPDQHQHSEQDNQQSGGTVDPGQRAGGESPAEQGHDGAEEHPPEKGS